MSTVIWYKGDMYADTQGTIDGETVDGVEMAPEIIQIDKIFKKDGKLYGVTGYLGGWDVFQDRRKKNGFYWCFTKQPEATILEYDGEKITAWIFKQTSFLGIYVSRFLKKNMTHCDEWVVSGSGNCHAVEALKLGLGPEEAIKYASRRDPYTNDSVIKVSL